MANQTPQSPLKSLAFGDLDREIRFTRRVLERLPEQHLAWKAHEKSMSLGNLALHVANLLQWMLDTLERDELDLTKTPPMRKRPDSFKDVLDTFDRNAAAVTTAMSNADDTRLAAPWSLRNGPDIILTQPRAAILRMWCLSHMIHHRAQLCVYLRLLNLPVPAVYFNSADEPDWTFE